MLQAATSRVPKLIDLADLERAARDVDSGSSSVETVRRIAMAGSSLGGARPKATVQDDQGRLLMAKFTSSDDTIDVVAWEKVCLDIAAKAGITVPTTKLMHVSRRAVLLLERFDRRYDSGNEQRVPYMSGLTLLDLFDGDRASMVEIAESFQPIAARPELDLPELFRRTALNLLVGNTDNHLRNHGFLRFPGGWRLSPLFDVTPATTKTDFATSIDPSREDSLDTLMEMSEWFGLSEDLALQELTRVVKANKNWRQLAREHGIPSSQDDVVALGFEGAHTIRARELTKGLDS